MSNDVKLRSERVESIRRIESSLSETKKNMIKTQIRNLGAHSKSSSSSYLKASGTVKLKKAL